MPRFRTCLKLRSVPALRNWRRPPAEVTALMALLRSYLATEVERLVRNGVRLRVIGRRDR